MHIRNPVEWGVDLVRSTGHAVESMGQARFWNPSTLDARSPTIRRIGTSDLVDALRNGVKDFAAFRTDVIFLCVMFPVIGLVLARFALGNGMLPLLFPLASGFALIGPLAAVGLNEMSRQRERGLEPGWAAPLGVVRAPAFGAIVSLGLLLFTIFLLWLGAAAVIYDLTLGPEPPVSVAGFASDVFTTSAGWVLIVVGFGVGFLFALLVLAISVVSFPVLLDRGVGVGTAIRTSLRAVGANPLVMALWGMIVAAALALGSLPFFVGLVIVMPVLGHATWHLYRKVVPSAE